MKIADCRRHTKPTALVAFVMCGLMSACSSAGDNAEPPPPPRFVTHIDADGVKLFTLMMEGGPGKGGRRPPSGGPPGGGAGGGGPPPGGPGGRPPEGMGPPGGGGPADDPAMKERTTAGLRRMLEIQLAQTGFCSGGHEEIDASVEPTGSRISGRCKDTATDLDRTHFPNMQP